MKQILSRALALLLVLTLLAGFSVCFAAEESAGDLRLVSLGDSVANGYGTEGYFENGNNTVRGYKTKLPYAFPTIVARELGIDVESENFQQLAFSGFRPEELHHVLDASYPGDDYTRLYFYEDPLFERCGGGIDQMREDFAKYISEADIITVNVGANNFGTFMQMQISRYQDGKEPMDVSLSPSMLALLDTPQWREFEENVRAQLGDAGTALGLIDLLLRSLRYTYAGFKTHFDASMDCIYKLNPDAEIVVVGMYNMVEGVHLTNDMINIGAIVGAFMDLVNFHMRVVCPHAKDYSFVDVMGCEIFGMPKNITDPGFIPAITENYGIAVHPNENGQQFIADRVLNALQIPYQDVDPAAWYAPGVRYVTNHGLMNGIGGSLFAPAAITTRDQLAATLYRLAGSPDVTGLTEPFIDVPDSSWAHDAIVWAYNEGVVNGVTAHTFLPLAAVSRQQLATMLWRYAGSPESAGELSGFYDRELVASWARDAMAWAVEQGLVTGVTTHTLLPIGTATRGQLATILMRFSKL